MHRTPFRPRYTSSALHAITLRPSTTHTLQILGRARTTAISVAPSGSSSHYQSKGYSLRRAAAAMTPPSPSASLYAVSDNEEGEYNTITHKSSGKGVKLLCSKSKVRLFGPLIYRLDLPAPRSTCIPRHQPGTTLPDLLRSFNRKVQHQNDNPPAHSPPLPLQHLLNHHLPHPSYLRGSRNIH